MFGRSVGPRLTGQSLLDLAAAAGTPVSSRLITDWVSLGLLDRPEKRSLGYRGSLPGDWPAAQGDLLKLLLGLRAQGRAVEALCNIPVRLWLTEGDVWIPMRQARRALTTWATRGAAGNKRVFRRLLGEMLPRAVDPGLSLVSRPKLDHQLRMAFHRSNRLDRNRLEQILGEVTIAASSFSTTPGSAVLSTGAVVTLLESIRQTISSVGKVSDEAFLVARLLLRMGVFTPRDSAFGHSMTATDVLATLQGQTLEAVLNKTCLDLAITLGLLQASPGYLAIKGGG
jgi:hypothetical protein